MIFNLMDILQIENFFVSFVLVKPKVPVKMMIGLVQVTRANVFDGLGGDDYIVGGTGDDQLSGGEW